ncbi:NYN domain-containing protein [Rhodovulum tesquicola]|uniref:NYN domain-containing protein n=1 Tax=Rhodovulum tesquicola TaxID=540254 RepID=UPI0020977795|nr:NYN domain-containing protein [Rhodovulum tesquicola]MCO8145726.1 NYN domain-containing protein [Rhodovulum tesquicola]
MFQGSAIGRVAVFVDGDNVPAPHAPAILTAAREWGEPHVLRTYGQAQNLTPWQEVPGFRFFCAGMEKNGADLLLAIDAIELALTDPPETFVIVSSDRDFRHLAIRLRERRLRVLGMGRASSAPAFRSACSAFIELGAASPPVFRTSNSVAAPAPAKTEPMPTDPAIAPLDRKIRETILAAPGKGRMEITRLSAELHKLHGVRIGSQPEKTWRGYLGKRPNLYLLDPKGPNACVRLRTEGWPAG